MLGLGAFGWGGGHLLLDGPGPLSPGDKGLQPLQTNAVPLGRGAELLGWPGLAGTVSLLGWDEHQRDICEPCLGHCVPFSWDRGLITGFWVPSVRTRAKALLGTVSPWACGVSELRNLSTVGTSFLLVSFCDDSSRQFTPCQAYVGQALC